MGNNSIKVYKMPSCLKGTTSRIVATSNTTTGAKYNYEIWKKHFKGKGVVLQDLAYIHSICPSIITRNDIEQFVKAFQNGTCSIRRPFLATMIWGWINRWRGRHNVELSYSDTRLDGNLKKVFELIQANKIQEVYNVFDVDGCGPAFFTKFFYFIGRALDIKPLPLILDTQVAKYLELICIQEGWKLDDFVAVSRDDKNRISSTGRNVEGYLRYIHSMNSWANQLGCNADDVELFMYMQRDKSSRKGEIMVNKNTDRLPLRAAAQFAANHGLKHAIDTSKLGYPERRGLYMELFTSAGLWGLFIKQCWPNATTKDGQKKIGLYKKRAQPHLSVLGVKTGKLTSLQPLQIQLTSKQIQKLGKIANEWAVQDSDLARVWICERLSTFRP